jgi:hypothetical protein
MHSGLVMASFSRTVILSLLLAGSCAASASAGILLDLKATNYDPATGVWTDSSGNGDSATAPAGAMPTLLSDATPNGSSAVQFTSGDLLNLTSAIPESGNGFTVFAFEESSGDGSSKTIVSGGANAPGSFQYRIGGDSHGEVQELLSQGLSNLGQSDTPLGDTFHLIDVAANSSGATFRTDGLDDGTAGGATFNPITTIGSANSDEYFVGDIAEIQVYSGVLSSAQISSVEASLEASYVNPVPEPSSILLLGLAAGSLGIACRRYRLDDHSRRSPPAIATEDAL